MSKRFQVPPQDTELNLPILLRVYDWYKSMYLDLSSFPKAQKYTLGLKIDATILETLEILILAGNNRGEQKAANLEVAQIKLDILKILIRLAKDIHALDNKKYLAHQTRLQEIGRMLGGWARSTKQSLQGF